MKSSIDKIKFEKMRTDHKTKMLEHKLTMMDIKNTDITQCNKIELPKPIPIQTKQSLDNDRSRVQN
jgi:hypothetical protein